MKKISYLLLTLTCILVSACHKKSADTPAASQSMSTEVASAAQANAPATQAAASNPEPSEAEQELERKKQLMAYASMEDQYLNDTKAQWAIDAKASSTFGDDQRSGPSSTNAVVNTKGSVDGKTWTNNRQDMGFDWLELSYEKPVSASEVRIIFENGAGVEAISKIELQSTDGKWNTVWEGISDQKQDRRGNRTWFVRSFEKTTYKAKAVKLTLANNLQRGYKEIDAVQLVGE
ncbi:hypothetical protein [Undibacterium fentianense]|uniref:F5/8 type C domain-containing protein n=1 Tax=Undibacterium fentianense TaxID=2828728 RepID=A0A941E075_9BURK|nr:hypothetical protein [Undibacterium fentianense]MBR7800784.1 hypothetical protein [Undibacterium fentianense]